MSNTMIPILQAGIYIIIAIMVGLAGLYFYFLSHNIKNRYDYTKTDINGDNMEQEAKEDEDDPINNK